MDATLGASDADGHVGLLYQWGSKDPFLGGQTYNTKQRSSVNAADNVAMIDYTIKHPQVLIRGYDTGDKYGDWLMTTNNTLWGSYRYKTIYDPFPLGYPVSPEDVFADLTVANPPTALPETVTTTDYRQSFDYYNMVYNQEKTARYPTAGQIYGAYASLLYQLTGYSSTRDPGNHNYCLSWTSFADSDNYARSLDIHTYHDTNDNNARGIFKLLIPSGIDFQSHYKSNAQSVRCVREND